ncbi:MAG: cohesin domain-containing protein [candidate division KSB1 bacterium]|nr:cohesin domain-containing protein [candidate division KSB1 bacterium]MDZ7276592.1 cohesin domain-containing protein [candidate division KSB1 bacterium]MDZ7288235.1 cohesin domain-containing protein [candidate division KSB1 bacterium]MDZ7300374.1 cohesin domain-containing protein [candidate division KSB1 bacterium]MDZ7307808.1 cohesin domain-containing protein [candidate division KSB1 bacterium]
MKSVKLLVCCCLPLLLNVPAAWPQPIEVRLPAKLVASRGDTIIVPVTVGNLTDRLVIAYQATITFDGSVLAAVSASSAGTLSESFGDPLFNNSLPGQIKVGSFGALPLSGAGVLVNLVFTVVGAPGDSTALTFAEFLFNSGDPPAVTYNGSLFIPAVTGLASPTGLPRHFMLSQNSPNPFVSTTQIALELPAAAPAPVALRVFNLQGQLVVTLFAGALPPGRYLVTWDGRDSFDQPVAAGIYLYQLIAGTRVETRRLLLAR